MLPRAGALPSVNLHPPPSSMPGVRFHSRSLSCPVQLPSTIPGIGKASPAQRASDRRSRRAGGRGSGDHGYTAGRAREGGGDPGWAPAHILSLWTKHWPPDLRGPCLGCPCLGCPIVSVVSKDESLPHSLVHSVCVHGAVPRLSPWSGQLRGTCAATTANRKEERQGGQQGWGRSGMTGGS